MKIKEIKSKELRRINETGKLYAVGYCQIANLLRNTQRVGYNAGAYGWNCDIYDFGNVIIATGYRLNVGKLVDWELCKRYDDLARETEKTEELEKLLNEFLNELTKLK